MKSDYEYESHHCPVCDRMISGITVCYPCRAVWRAYLGLPTWIKNEVEFKGIGNHLDMRLQTAYNLQRSSYDGQPAF